MIEENKENGFLNSNIIKLIAIIAMTIDHIAWSIFPSNSREILPVIMHIIGRITFPIMCYFIAEGYYHTRDINKYTARLFIFAFISHFPFIYAFNFIDVKSFIPFYYGTYINQTSVLWSLAWGLVMLRIYNSTKIQQNYIKTGLILLICLITIPSDWSFIGSLSVLVLGVYRGQKNKQFIWIFVLVAIFSLIFILPFDILYGFIQLGVILSFPLLYFYNGKRGINKTINKVMKWLFYIFYPFHLLILGSIF